MRFRLLARTVSAVILLAFASSLAYGTVEFAATSSNGAETSTPALLTVNVAPTPTSAPVTVDYDVTGGTASGGGVDYTLASGTLNFAIGVGSQDISVTIVDDALDEADETVIVTLSNPTGDTLGTNTAHTYTINDDDPTPTVEFDLTSSNASEATTPADLAVSLSAASGQTITVDYDVTGGTATGSGTDYTLASGTLTFLPSETTHNVSAAIVDDALDEVDETIIVTLSNPSNATLGANTLHTYTINDDDPTPTVEFDLTSSNASEATTPADLAVSLAAASGLTVTVDYDVTGGTATGGGVDYTLASGVLTFLPGETTHNVSAVIVDDLLDETDETIIVTLSNPTNATLGTNTLHTYTINDDEAATVEFDLVSSNGSEATASVDLAVSLSVVSTFTVTVDYDVTGGTATGGGVDYTLASGTLTFLPSETTHNITGTVVEDVLNEADETIIVTLSNPTNATLGTNTVHTYTINDNDGAPTVEFDLAVSSGAETITPTNLAVSLSATSGQTVTVNYAVSGGTATGGGVDYSLASGVLTFLPGEITHNISATIVDDLLDEANETIIVALSSPTNATLGPTNPHTYTILDNEPTPIVEFDLVSSNGSEATTPADLAVSLSGPSGQTVTVDYAVTGGTATGGGVDYSLASGTLTFLSGETTHNISAIIVDDLVDEDDETIIVTLSNAVNVALGANTVHTYTINDNDAATVDFDLTASNASEATTPANMSVSLSIASSFTVTVDYDVTGGTATGGGVDYTLASGTLTFLPGEITHNISAIIVDDLLDEADETIAVTLSNAVNAAMGANTLHTYTINDDDAAPTVEFDSPSSSGLEFVTAISLPVSLSVASGQTVTVDYDVTGGTATGGGVDYTLASGMLTFLPGETANSIPITITDDALTESDETIIVTLSNPANASLGGTTDHTYTIFDDESANFVQFALVSSNGSEATPALSLNVTLSPSSSNTVTVDYAVTGGTATGGGVDYTLTPGTLTFLPGETSHNIPGTVVDDALSEANETIIVTLSNPTNAFIGTNGSHTYTINDNEPAPTVQFNLATSSGSEATTPANLAVSLSTASGQTVTVDYAVTGGTATGGGVDYTLAPGTLTFLAGEITKNIAPDIFDDLLDEVDESIIVTLSNPTNVTLGTRKTHTYVIVDDDPPGAFTVQFNSATSSGSEATTPANLAVSLSGPSGLAVTVDYAVTGGTATGGGVDYTLTPGTLTFLPGEVTKNIPVTISEDVSDETDETIIVALSNPTIATLGTPSQHTYFIIDNDPPPEVQFIVDSSSGFEFVTPALLSVSLSTTSSQTVSVDYAVTGGTATGGGVDYTLAAGTLTFLPGETTGNILATIVNDALAEADETIIVSLSNPSNCILGSNTDHTYTISDDEGQTFLSFTAASSSGLESVTAVSLAVRASPTPTAALTVDYAPTGGTATGGVDYTLVPGTLTFLAGQATRNISVTVVNDTTYELGETIIVTLSNPSGAFLKAPINHTYTINNNDSMPVVGFASAASSGPENSTPALLTVNVTPASGATTQVNYAVTGGTATNGVDYTLTAGTLTFLPGETSKDISATIIDDVIFEGDETIVVTLSSPTNATLGTATHTYTITENEVPIQVQFSAVSSSDWENVTPALFAVNVSPTPTTTPVTVDYAVTGGTATGGGIDYTLAPGTLTFLVGEATKNISAAIVDDAWAEVDETINIALSNPTNAQLGAYSAHTYTILDDEPTPVGFVEDVESGENGWLGIGLWHIVASPNPYAEAHSPTHSWWYGRDATGNYNTGSANTGDLTSPHIEFPADGTLAFWSFEQTESNVTYDTKKVFVKTDSGGTWDLVYQSPGTPKLTWHQPAIDLSSYAGEEGFVKFEFDTTDQWYNNYRGWYVDDMVLALIPPTPIPALVDDMESGPDKWDATGLWHIVSTATNPYGEAASGTHSWWYGQDLTGNYDTGVANSGRLESRPFPLAAGSELWFMTWEQVEPTFDLPLPGNPFDRRRVWISTDAGSTWDPIPLYYSNVATTSGWSQVTVDVSSYSSPNAMIAFEFDTIDDYANNYRGWYVDDVSVAPNSFDDDMESGSANWDADGLWHMVDTTTPGPDPYADANSPTHSWWYGQPGTGNYDTGAPNSGALDSTVFRVGAGQTMAFYNWEQVEVQAGLTYDLRQVYVSADGGTTWSLVYTSDGALQETWHQAVVDLASYEDKTIRVRFNFNSVDALFNNFRGWYVDDVRAVTGVPPVLEDDFEGGAPGWVPTGTGFWHMVEQGVDPYADAHSATHSWWYGQASTGDYDNGAHNYGSLFSPEFVLPSAAALKFWNWEQTENFVGFDLIKVNLWLDGGAEFHNVYLSDGSQQGVWFEATVDLSGYTSTQAQLEFVFDTWDNIGNNYRGWYVDDVTVGQ